MLRQIPLFGILLIVILGPIALRPRTERASASGVEELVIITPHDQAIREEFARAFAAEHFVRTGRHVRIDWRTPGGTSDAVRYLESEYLGSFQNYWEHTLRKGWNSVVAGSFANSQVTPAASPAVDTPAQEARRAFLSSNVGCGIDLFFGGGSFDFARQAADGRLVDSGFRSSHPELFGDRGIPEKLNGEKMWDANGGWLGVCLSSFGICYNTDSLARLALPPPRRWEDLTNPHYFREIALANPTQSASVNRTFEMLIQQQILEVLAAQKAAAPNAGPALETEAVREGWQRGMRMLMKIGANARYFTDSSSKIALDVASGEAAAGMSIDFYGRFESEAVRKTDGSSRLQYLEAAGGTSFSADTIGLLRGAPHAELAREFIAWTLSLQGQALWDWKVGAPDGPQRYSLRRLPILPSLYAPAFRAFRADPEVNPYAPENTFVYHPSWTGPLFNAIAYITRVMCIDSHDELAEAWQALIAAHFPPHATQAFSSVDLVDYQAANTRIRAVLNPIEPADVRLARINQVRLAKELADGFRAQYVRATELARKGE